jgi:hypothetical protein
VPVPLPDATRRRWEASGSKTQRVALLIGQWAEQQPPGTIVPADDVLISRYPKVNDRYGTPSLNNRITVGRAITILERMHILHRNRDTGHYHVAATEPAATTASARPAGKAPAAATTLPS